MHHLVKKASLSIVSSLTLSLICLTPMAAAAKEISVRTLHFERSPAIGAIYAMSNMDTAVSRADMKARHIGVAQGDMKVSLKPHEGILLDLGRGAFDNPRLLDKAKLDNIEGLKLSYLAFDVGDGKVFDNLARYIPRFKMLTDMIFDRSDCSDATLAYFKETPELTSLSCYSTHVEGAGLKHLTGLKKLAILSLESCVLKEEFLPYLPQLKNLQSLQISGAGLTDKSMKIIARCPSLKTLKMPKNQKVTDAGIAELKNCKTLEAMDFRELRISIRGMRELKNLKLKGAVLDEKSFTPKERQEIQAMWPKAGFRWFKPFVDKDHETLLAPLH